MNVHIATWGPEVHVEDGPDEIGVRWTVCGRFYGNSKYASREGLVNWVWTRTDAPATCLWCVCVVRYMRWNAHP